MIGSDVCAERILAARPLLPSADEVLPYLRRIDASRYYSNWGPLCGEFETRLARFLRLPVGGLTVASSGTSALIGAILAVAGPATPQRPLAVVPAFTFPATAAAVERCGYVPYLVDVNAETWQLEANTLLSCRVLDRAGVVVPVATFGRPVRQDDWKAFREATGIPVVIDGAASFDRFATDSRPQLGSIPVAISFHATKAFGIGEGGAVASTDPELVELATQALNFGFSGTRNSRGASFNGKLSEYHAAVGLAELDGWRQKSAALVTVADRYRSSVDRHELSRSLVIAAPDISATYVLFHARDVVEAARVRRNLRQHGIGHRLWYERGLQHHDGFESVDHDDLATTERLAECLLGLPVAPDLSEEDIHEVVDTIVKGLRET